MYFKKNNILYFIICFFLFSLKANSFEIKDSFENFKKSFFDETYKDDPKFLRHRIEIESGIADILYNKIGNNENSGSLFNTTKIEDNLNFYARFSYYFNLDKKNSFKLMVAPLSIAGNGRIEDTFTYGDENFNAGGVSYFYKFNSYRLSYRRSIFENDKFTIRLGITFKIRDAMIRLTQGDNSYSESNIGFVPLGHLNIEYRPIENLTFVFEGDLAAAPQGRAFDLAFSTKYDINKHLDISLGYRLLEGGAINSRVYNMALINYYFTSIGFKF